MAWGWNDYGQCNVPSPNEDFIAVAGGYGHSLGLKSDSTIVAWGNNGYSQCNVPSPNEDFIAVAGGDNHSLGLKSDGTIVAWGENGRGQCNVPSPNEDFIAVAGGYRHSLGLKSDGTIVAWGTNDYGQCNVPSPNENFIAVAGGGWHSLGLKSSPVTGIQDIDRGNMPGAASIAIRSLFPNPFNPSMEISFEMLVPGSVTLEIFDVGGRRIGDVALGSFDPGLHRVHWDAQKLDLSSGMYFLRLRGAMGESRAMKALLLR